MLFLHLCRKAVKEEKQRDVASHQWRFLYPSAPWWAPLWSCRRWCDPGRAVQLFFFLAIYSITMFKRALIEMDLLLMCAKGPAKEMLNWLKNYIYIRDSFTFRLEPSLWLKFITSFPVPVGAVLPVSPQDMSEIA